MKKAKKATAKENNFFEEVESLSTKDISKEEKQTKEVIAKEQSAGEFYFKNVVYKYKNGETCRVCYNKDDANYIERIMN